MSNPLSKLFKGWRLFLAVAIGLSVSIWMLLMNVNKEFYVESDGGSYTWVDSNEDGQIDFSSDEEFEKSTNGNYTKVDFFESFKFISWGKNGWFWMVLAIVFVLLRDVFYIIRIRLLSKSGLSWKSSTNVILIWEFASALTPGVVGGTAVAMFILNREGISMGKSTAMVIITAFMDNLFYVVMIPLVLIFISQDKLIGTSAESSLFLTTWFWGGFAIISCICLLLYTSIFWRPTLIGSIFKSVCRIPFLRKFAERADQLSQDVMTSSKEFKDEPRRYWFKIFGATFCSWISRYLVINAILNAFLSLSFQDNIVVLGKQLILWLFMLVSPTPGGSGVAEFAFSELLDGFGASVVLLTLMGLLWRLLSYFPYLFIGSLIIPFWLKRDPKERNI